MILTEKYIRYVDTVKRYSPKTVRTYHDILDDFVTYAFNGSGPVSSGCSRGDTVIPDNEMMEILTPCMIRSYEVYLMDTRKVIPRTVNLHLSVLRIGEGHLGIGAVELEEFQRNVLPQFVAGHVLAHLDDHVVESGVEDVDFLDQFAHAVHDASGVAVGKSFGTYGGRGEQNHELLVRVVVEKGKSEQIGASAFRTGPQEHLPALDLLLEFGAGRYVHAAGEVYLVSLSAVAADYFFLLSTHTQILYTQNPHIRNMAR